MEPILHHVIQFMECQFIRAELKLRWKDGLNDILQPRHMKLVVSKFRNVCQDGVFALLIAINKQWKILNFKIRLQFGTMQLRMLVDEFGEAEDSAGRNRQVEESHMVTAILKILIQSSIHNFRQVISQCIFNSFAEIFVVLEAD